MSCSHGDEPQSKLHGGPGLHSPGAAGGGGAGGAGGVGGDGGDGGADGGSRSNLMKHAGGIVCSLQPFMVPGMGTW